MRPRFNRVLEMDPDGTLVIAKGPIEFDGSEKEAYIAVWISQDHATGLGIAEEEKEFFLDAVAAAELRLQDLPRGASAEDVDEAGPLWNVVVKTVGQPFTPGPAKAEGWISLELPGEHSYRVMWTDDVELRTTPGLSE